MNIFAIFYYLGMHRYVLLVTFSLEQDGNLWNATPAPAYLMLGHLLCTLYWDITGVSLYEEGSQGGIREDVHMQFSWPVREIALPAKLTALLCVHINYLHFVFCWKNDKSSPRKILLWIIQVLNEPEWMSPPYRTTTV